MKQGIRWATWALCVGGMCLGCRPEAERVDEVPAADAAPAWWKGNLHTHSLWSDGDDYPEMIVDWYKAHGYQFIALSDHNTLAEGEKWIDAEEAAGGLAAYERYLKQFGDAWIEQREADGRLQVRLKTLAEYRPRFEEPGRFLLIQSEEITDGFEQKPIHVNATNAVERIEPRGGKSVRDVMQRNVDAILAQRAQTGTPVMPHINHPNFGWAVTAEDLIALEGERFFEVYNGHPLVHNEGNDHHPGVERLWDIILAERLTMGEDVLYGLAVDDAHNYHAFTGKHSNPGRGWIMVRSAELTAEAIIAALEAGDFYATTGVELDDVSREEDRLAIRIRPQEGVTYTTRFIGTRTGYDRHSEPLVDAEGQAVTRQYSAAVGVVLDEVEGLTPSYTRQGDELYVRATVLSSKPKANPYREGEMETAWVQPLVTGAAE